LQSFVIIRTRMSIIPTLFSIMCAATYRGVILPFVETTQNSRWYWQLRFRWRLSKRGI